MSNFGIGHSSLSQEAGPLLVDIEVYEKYEYKDVVMTHVRCTNNLENYHHIYLICLF